MWAAHVAWCMDLNRHDFLGHEYFGFSERLNYPWFGRRCLYILWSEDLWNFH